MKNKAMRQTKFLDLKAKDSSCNYLPAKIEVRDTYYIAGFRFIILFY